MKSFENRSNGIFQSAALATVIAMGAAGCGARTDIGLDIGSEDGHTATQVTDSSSGEGGKGATSFDAGTGGVDPSDAASNAVCQPAYQRMGLVENGPANPTYNDQPKGMATLICMMTLYQEWLEEHLSAKNGTVHPSNAAFACIPTKGLLVPGAVECTGADSKTVQINCGSLQASDHLYEDDEPCTPGAIRSDELGNALYAYFRKKLEEADPEIGTSWIFSIPGPDLGDNAKKNMEWMTATAGVCSGVIVFKTGQLPQLEAGMYDASAFIKKAKDACEENPYDSGKAWIKASLSTDSNGAGQAAKFFGQHVLLNERVQK